MTHDIAMAPRAQDIFVWVFKESFCLLLFCLII